MYRRKFIGVIIDDTVFSFNQTTYFHLKSFDYLKSKDFVVLGKDF